MEEIIQNILAELRAGRTVDDRALVKLIHAQARKDGADKRCYAKRQLLPFYQRVKHDEPERWASWDVTSELEARLLAVLRMKPRRSASGVATITVITKPWPCSSDCRYCPSDVRCPKSYLHDEPACARAEQNFFDPYLQVTARLTALEEMGHATDKIELIVLGGTWTDYPEDYQVWFAMELFRALNEFEGGLLRAGAGVAPSIDGEALVDAVSDVEDGSGAGAGSAAMEGGPSPSELVEGYPPSGLGEGYPFIGLDGDAQGQRAFSGLPLRGEELSCDDDAAAHRAWYRSCGVPEGEAALMAFSEAVQKEVDKGERTYNQAVMALYRGDAAWRRASAIQHGDYDLLERAQRENEGARHRAVGLVIETRPDAITPASLVRARRLGCTKIQMGVQSLDQRVLDANERGICVGQIGEAFELLRAFGFKIHVHTMVNLLGSTPAHDKEDYRRLMGERAFQPDEVKIYPCALIEGARLCRDHEAGIWRPYSEEELLDVLEADVRATPPFTRVSRMIRDFSTGDIVAGNKKPNLRQLVEARLREGDEGTPIQEIRYREVGTHAVDASALSMERISYLTSNTREWFLQWVTPEGRIAGFLRLSLPDALWMGERRGELPAELGVAMIREVHVYGMSTHLGERGEAAQHLGLGRRLVEAACAIAREAGFAHINVISAVGTRAYYRSLGFADAGLYQRRGL